MKILERLFDACVLLRQCRSANNKNRRALFISNERCEQFRLSRSLEEIKRNEATEIWREIFSIFPEKYPKNNFPNLQTERPSKKKNGGSKIRDIKTLLDSLLRPREIITGRNEAINFQLSCFIPFYISITLVEWYFPPQITKQSWCSCKKKKNRNETVIIITCC